MPSISEFTTVHIDSSWVTIGSFDGVHLGHRSLITNLVSGAHAAGSQAVVITFFPHPVVVLRGFQGPYYLTTPEARAELLLQLGVDQVITLPFDRRMASMSAEEFMRGLREQLGVKQLWIGQDFALGRNREGDIARLEELGNELKYGVKVIKPVTMGEGVVSSSLIRSLVQQGNVRRAVELLGHAYAIGGEVVHGEGRGHGLGFATANLSIWQEQLLPASGVYATWARLGEERFPSITNVGLRPTFEKFAAPRIETHILDFSKDIYGQQLVVEFVEHLRPEQRFTSVDALISQVFSDINRAREVLAHDA